MGYRLSAEKVQGWHRLYFSLADWPDRIRETHHSPNRSRDELTYYLCFFSQAYSVRDWLIKQRVMKSEELDSAVRATPAMQACRDICNRYKHFTISNPSLDAEWSIQRRLTSPFHDNEWEWTIMAGEHQWPLWDLMIECIGFWEAVVASYGLTVDGR